MLIDSGAGECFINHDVVKEHQMAPQPLSNPIKVRNIDGTSNESGHITAFVRLTLTMAQQTFQIK